MSGYVTTHILDTAQGKPARGVAITLYRINEDGTRLLLHSATTNDDGRTDKPILSQELFQTGRYELQFQIGAYFENSGAVGQGIPFLDMIPIQFGLSETAHYHVPLLVSPFGYSTYRGS